MVCRVVGGLIGDIEQVVVVGVVSGTEGSLRLPPLLDLLHVKLHLVFHKVPYLVLCCS